MTLHLVSGRSGGPPAAGPVHNWPDRRAMKTCPVLSLVEGGQMEVRFALDVQAAARARDAVVQWMGDSVASSVLDHCKLLVSELVTNSVRHSGMPADEQVVVRVGVTGENVRIEVEDPGTEGSIAPRTADVDSGGGFGLLIVQMISEKWGVDRAARRGTRVWALLTRSPDDMFDTGEVLGASGPARDPITDWARKEPPMALELLHTERFHLAGNISRDASFQSVEQRVVEILTRQEMDTQLRRNAEELTERFAIRRQSSDTGRLKRAIANRARAHRTVMGMSEGVLGAPRSGSA